MRVKLIDVDSKIPNFALMQVSSYHKRLGDECGFDTENPERVYISCIFTKNKAKAFGIATLYPNAEVVLGGTGINLTTEIPSAAQFCMPDYSLYPEMDYSLGFTTRGCIRKCPFCFVPVKEGKIHRAMRISDFHNPAFNQVWLLDNNMYADKDWFFENTDYLIENNLKLKVTQGFDVRLLNEEIAERLHQVKWVRGLSFAFDNIGDEHAVRKGIEILKQVGFNLKDRISFFVLTGFNTTHQQDLYRVNLLKELGCNAFVMQYKPDEFTRVLAHWANRRWSYWAYDFEQFDGYINYSKKFGSSNERLL